MYQIFQMMFAKVGRNNVNIFRKSSNSLFRIKGASGIKQSAFWPEKSGKCEMLSNLPPS